MTITPEAHYVAGGDAYRYPHVGDPRPPGGAKVLLLTKGGVCVVGNWSDDVIGWAPLPRRDMTKEATL